MTQGSNPCTPQNELGFLVVTALTMISKLQDSSNKRKMDYPRLILFLILKLKHNVNKI